VIENEAGDMPNRFWAGRMRRFAWSGDAPRANQDQVYPLLSGQAHNFLLRSAAQKNALKLVCGRRAAGPALAQKRLGCCQYLFSCFLLGLHDLGEQVRAALTQANKALAQALHLVAGAAVNDIEQDDMQPVGVQQAECPASKPISIGTVQAK
jgi:hypothetical protein